ncbi:uncharacterized protein DSM5745_08017 [Aspergillus mulundensis]|uniref:Uncharacterized protein n=1 Tax=Aspergillus mulundensis TaxID=1810919 RepID=A0A3D8R944_9EURO|nr:hypothetical protein DSM5745_08017 [Aspergillus mulundensis]RDW70506.1 hypothetical protein DSM5745_08017 [Aspergillus mulundensis]
MPACIPQGTGHGPPHMVWAIDPWESTTPLTRSQYLLHVPDPLPPPPSPPYAPNANILYLPAVFFRISFPTTKNGTGTKRSTNCKHAINIERVAEEYDGDHGRAEDLYWLIVSVEEIRQGDVRADDEPDGEEGVPDVKHDERFLLLVFYSRPPYISQAQAENQGTCNGKDTPRQRQPEAHLGLEDAAVPPGQNHNRPVAQRGEDDAPDRGADEGGQAEKPDLRRVEVVGGKEGVEGLRRCHEGDSGHGEEDKQGLVDLAQGGLFGGGDEGHALEIAAWWGGEGGGACAGGVRGGWCTLLARFCLLGSRDIWSRKVGVGLVGRSARWASVQHGDELGFLEEKDHGDEVGRNQGNGDPPHGAPSQILDRVPHCHGPQEGPDGLHEEEDPIHEGVLVDEKEISDGEHDDRLTDRPPDAGDEARCDDFAVARHLRAPDGSDQLHRAAEQVNRPAAVSVGKGDEKNAPGGETCVVGGDGVVQIAIACPEVLLVGRKRDSDIAHGDEGIDHEGACQAKVDGLSQLRPVIGFIQSWLGMGCRAIWEEEPVSSLSASTATPYTWLTYFLRVEWFQEETRPPGVAPGLDPWSMLVLGNFQRQVEGLIQVQLSSP